MCVYWKKLKLIVFMFVFIFLNLFAKDDIALNKELNILIKTEKNKYFASYSLSRSMLLVWDRKTNKPIQKIKLSKDNFDMALSFDKKILAVANKDNIYLYKVNKYKREKNR